MSALWSVRNGFLGTGQVAALVVAETEAEARAIGAAALASDIQNNPVYDQEERERYGQVRSIVRVDLPYVGDELP